MSKRKGKQPAPSGVPRIMPPATPSPHTPVSKAARTAAKRAADAPVSQPFAPDAELPAVPTAEAAAVVAGVERLAIPAAMAPRASDGLDPAALAQLRAHVINLNQGRFSQGGRFTSTKEDVDALFREHLRAWLAAGGTGPARIVLFAHGGLVGEESGLTIAAHQTPWWMANGVYPIHFVWETGFWETISQIITGSAGRALGRRDLADWTTDPVLEALARVFGGPTIWSGMKRSAERSFDAAGGGRRALTLLQEEIDRSDRDIEFHLVGHSAGSILHAHLLQAARSLGLPAAQTLTLMAPAITVEEFRARVAPLVGSAVKRVKMFTMARDLERADNCGPYQKSLLYLIRASLEAESGTEILGLEESLRRNGDVARLFGLANATNPPGDIAFSGTAPGVTEATAHGAFDDDPATMNSVLRHVLGADATSIIGFAPAAARTFDVEQDLREEMDRRGIDVPAHRGPTVTVDPVVDSQDDEAEDAPPGGKRLALCIGINRYSASPLSGCVADARLWHETLAQLGFDVRAPLLDAEATREGILAAMRGILRSATAGDVVVMQYAGHGTRIRDVDGDEADGDTPGFDEAMVPFDYEAGAFVIDDDLAEVFRAAPRGVNITCIFDCCHSGTMNRIFAAPLGIDAAPADCTDQRRRFLPVNEVLTSRHVAFRAQLAAAARGMSASRNARGVHAASEVFFSACRSSESAWESNGHGDFTRIATRILQKSTAELGNGAITNEGLLESVRSAFGTMARQLPELHCGDERRSLPLLAPTRDGRTSLGRTSSSLGAGDRAAIARSLEAIARRLR
ncbi:MAG: caspase family protein [Phycisphaerae bacterium]|nr:caspase family protein [Phycisphaerae bacterium]